LGLRRFYWWLRRRPVPKVRTEEKTAASVESERFLERYWVLFSLWLLLTTAWAWHGVAATDKVDMDPIFLLLFSSVGLCVWDLNLIMADESRLRPGPGRSGALGRYAIKAGLSIWDLPLIKGNKNRRRPVMGPAAPPGGALGHYEIMARLCIWDLPQIVEDWRRKPSEHGGELGRYDIAAFFHLTLMAIAFHLFAKAGCEAVAAGCLSAIVIFLLTAVRFLAGNAYHLYRWCGPGAPDGYHWSIDFALIFLEALVFIYLAQSIGRIWPEKQELWHDEFWPALFALFVIDLVFAGSTVVRGIRRWRSESPSARRGAIQFLGALRAYWADRERSKDLRVASKWTGFSLVLGALTLWAWPFGGNTKPIAFVILMLASLVIGVWDMYSIMDAVGAIASKPEAAPAPESAAAPASGAAPAA
jgi:hypothetical protein